MDLVVKHGGALRPVPAAQRSQQVLAHNHDGHACRTNVLLCAPVDDLRNTVQRVSPLLSRAVVWRGWRRPQRTPYLDTSTGLLQKLEDMSAMRMPGTTGSF